MNASLFHNLFGYNMWHISTLNHNHFNIFQKHESADLVLKYDWDQHAYRQNTREI
jgi:hypothetical protein